MFYKVFGSLIIITYFYTSKTKKIQHLQTTQYLDLWDDLDNSYELDDF
jgi:hypothetical protein